MKHPELLRKLTLTDAVGVGLGAIIGAGIFVVTGVAAGVSGPAFLIGLLIAGIVASFNALSSAQLAAVYPQSGGTYEYGYQLLHPSLGFSAGWMFLISKLSAAGVVSIGFGSYFHQLFPFSSPVIISLVTVVLLTAANILGVQKAGKLNLIIVSLTVLCLLYFIIGGFPEMRTENFVPFAPLGISGIAESAALMFFAFTGYARIATLAEEVKNPKETIPRAIIITIVSAVILYILVSFVAVGAVGTEVLAKSTSPLHEAASVLSFPGIKSTIAVGACTAMLGVLLSQILGISRMLLAMGRRGDLPHFFEAVHPKFRIPHIGILITGWVIFVITLSGSFEFIVRSASFTILLYYSITNLAALQQPKSQQLFGKAISVLGLMGCIVMAISLPVNVVISGISILILGFSVRFTVRYFSK